MADPTKARPLRLLFVGNSLTYVNDLPAMVAALAEGAGEPAPVWDAVVEGGFSLEDHWARGAAQRAIARGGWDFVVLQQGPSASPEGRQSLARDARRFAELVRKAGGRPALYMVWPSLARHGDFSGVVDSYRAAARLASVDAVLLPAGEAWRIAEKSAPGIALYSKDGLHPTVEGSYLAAAVIVARLYGRSPAGLPTLGLAEERARALREAADRALRLHPSLSSSGPFGRGSSGRPRVRRASPALFSSGPFGRGSNGRPRDRRASPALFSSGPFGRGSSGRPRVRRASPARPCAPPAEMERSC